MNRSSILSRFVVIALLFLGFAAPLFAQAMAGLQMAELTKKLQLTDQQQKQLAPIVEQRDKEAQALKTNTSLSRMQKFIGVLAIDAFGSATTNALLIDAG
jgi:hypothetical protein